MDGELEKRAWYAKPLRARYIDNADLWIEADRKMKERAESVRVEYVKAHGLPRHINMGLTTDKDIWGNNAADETAGKAAREIDGSGIVTFFTHPTAGTQQT